MAILRRSNEARILSYSVLLVAGAAIFFLAFNAIDESDVFYHIKTGELLWQTGTLPARDVFSSSAQGAPWVLHEWLAELAFYGVYHISGFWGLVVLSAILAVVTYLILFRIATGRGAATALTPLIGLTLGIFTFGLWVPRPHVFGYLFFAALFLLLEFHRSKGQATYLWVSAGLIWLWANTHASFVLGIALFLAYGLFAFVARTRLLLRPGAGPRWDAGIPYAFVLSIALSFVNPASYHAHLYSLTVRPVARAMSVVEWFPITSFLDHPDIIVVLAEIAFVLAFAGWWFVAKRRNLFFVGLLLGLSVLPFLSVRHIGFWVLAAVPVLAISLTEFFEKSDAFWLVWCKKAAYALAGILLIVGIIRVPSSAVNTRKVPVRAADFMQTQGIQGPFFNTYSEGGYLLWRFWPDEKVFIDGRSEVFFGAPVREFRAISRNLPDWTSLVYEKYGFNSFFVGYQPPSRLTSAYPMVVRLINDGWPLVYWDDATLIFVRNIPAHSALIEKYAIRYVAPWRPPERISDEQLIPALREIDRLLEMFPDSIILRRYAEELLRRAQ